MASTLAGRVAQSDLPGAGRSGIRSTRGDVVTVQDLSFEDNRTQSVPSVPAQMLSKVENSPILVKYLSLLIGLMVVLSFGVRPALGRAALAIRGEPS